MVDRFERFSLAIAEISRYWHKIATDEMENYGLKGNHAVYLVTMLRFPDGITAARLSELCCKDKADVSRAMNIMEKKGLIAKDTAAQTHYRAPLKLTDSGMTAAKQVCERAQLAVKAGGSGISDEQREIFYSTLEIIASNLHTVSEEGLPKK